jgi:hypothetical protein
MEELSKKHIQTIKDAAHKLTGAKRRAFEAQVTLDYLGGSARKAEAVFGWYRETVEMGPNELRTGIECLGNFSARGRDKTEEIVLQLEEDIRSLAEPQSQTDPKFQTPFKYTRIIARALRQALIDKKGWKDEELPTENTLGNILNRLGYRLRRVQKRKPIKRVKETDAIFESVHEVNEASDQREDSLRISIDTKAKVNVGEFSRKGMSRGAQATQALDHDVKPEHKLVPLGILEVCDDELTILFGTSHETSDFIVDGLEHRWDPNKKCYPQIRQLVINLDNGPDVASTCTQFMKRMVEFARTTGLEIVLAYYSSYHSKYNPVERCWTILEMHWNGALLDSIESVLNWAGTMTWKGIKPVVHLMDKVYHKGVSVAKKVFKKIQACLERHETLPKYSVRIQPNSA